MIFRSQGNVVSRDMKKVSCGLKYMSDHFASDLTYDIWSEKFSTSAVFTVILHSLTSCVEG